MVRKIKKEDQISYEKLGSLLESNFPKLYALDKIQAFEYNQVFVSVDNKEVNGFIHVIVTGTEADIANIVVDPTKRRNGIGKELIKHVIDTLKLSSLMLEVRVTNESAIAFYKKLGFQEIRRIKNYYGKEDAIAMKWVK